MITFIPLILAGFAIAQEQVSGLHFSHSLHVGENEIECTTCHESATTSLTGADNMLPEMETCGDCHEVDDDENCGQCHVSVDDPGVGVRITEYNTFFAHKKHVDKNIECITCHQKISKQEVTVPADLPKMGQCVDCHRKNTVSTECETCHGPGRAPRPASHQQSFIRRHGLIAANGAVEPSTGQVCGNCHTNNFCQDCHEGENLEHRIHPQNFENTHALNAQLKERDCTTCHSDRSFCAECHSERHVMPHNHTAGWANNIPGDGGRHKLAARHDLEYCMTCHQQNADQICATCHQ